MVKGKNMSLVKNRKRNITEDESENKVGKQEQTHDFSKKSKRKYFVKVFLHNICVLRH